MARDNDELEHDHDHDEDMELSPEEARSASLRSCNLLPI